MIYKKNEKSSYHVFVNCAGVQQVIGSPRTWVLKSMAELIARMHTVIVELNRSA